MEKSDYNRIKELVIKYIRATLNENEQIELDHYSSVYPSLKSFLKKVEQKDFIQEQYKIYKSFDTAKGWKFVLPNIKKVKKPKRISLIIARVAAALLIPLIVGSVLMHTNKLDNLKNLFTGPEIISIEPGKPEAVLTLSSGEKIVLNSARDTLFNDAGAKVAISKTTGIQYLSGVGIDKINVNASNPELKQLPLNILNTKRGAEYFITLSDGTKVWLNSETELKYPIAFMNKTREVYLKGEAYFEVAENKAKPFIVHSKDMTVRVTGTSFNIMNYSNDQDARTTLVEGQIIISNSNKNGEDIILNPNQQFIIDEKGFSVKNVNALLVTEWRNNYFGFEYEKLTAVMNKISRWYNVEFTYADESIKSYHFSGKIPKYENISTALDLLELTTHIHFKKEGDKIIIEKIEEQ